MDGGYVIKNEGLVLDILEKPETEVDVWRGAG